jgi:hypothetical protein
MFSQKKISSGTNKENLIRRHSMNKKNEFPLVVVLNEKRVIPVISVLSDDDDEEISIRSADVENFVVYNGKKTNANYVDLFDSESEEKNSSSSSTDECNNVFTIDSQQEKNEEIETSTPRDVFLLTSHEEILHSHQDSIEYSFTYGSTQTQTQPYTPLFSPHIHNLSENETQPHQNTQEISSPFNDYAFSNLSEIENGEMLISEPSNNRLVIFSTPDNHPEVEQEKEEDFDSFVSNVTLQTHFYHLQKIGKLMKKLGLDADIERYSQITKILDEFSKKRSREIYDNTLREENRVSSKKCKY